LKVFSKIQKINNYLKEKAALDVKKKILESLVSIFTRIALKKDLDSFGLSFAKTLKKFGVIWKLILGMFYFIIRLITNLRMKAPFQI